MYTDGMRKKKKPARYELGELLDSELEDLSAGYKGAPVTGLVRDAVELYIEKCLTNEPEVRKRYESARKKRLKDDRGKNLTLINGGDKKDD